MLILLVVQTFAMGILASTLFIRPTMHLNNVGDASLYAAVPFYALVHMLFDGCEALSQPILMQAQSFVCAQFHIQKA